MAMNRSLGEGKVTKITKKNAIIICERLGSVTFPLSAANVISNECMDLREKYSPDEILIFTAQKTAGDEKTSRYVASSVVKRRELMACSGKISETCEKFCYATVPKYGRVFIPYSARIEQGGKAWLGKGAEVNRSVALKIFRQPDINNCRFVAWSITLLSTAIPSSFPNLPSISSSALNGLSSTMSRLPSTNGQLRGAEKQPEVAVEQLGVIVTCGSSDYIFYSAQTGLCRIPVSSRQRWMELGRFARYDAVKLNVTAPDKVNWTAKNITDLGFIFEVTEDMMDVTKLHLNLKAVVNRVSLSSRSAWLWNDLIGRIYIPPGVFNRNLKVFGSVEVRAVYTGAFEDVPWCAQTVKVIADEKEKADEIRELNSQLLLTDDSWTVTYIQSQQQTFYGFMDNPAYGSVFMAWTDLNDSDIPPPTTSKCRATVYYQQRDGKHAWRAILVTRLDENGEPISYHPSFNHTGKRIMPEPFLAPQPVARTVVAPPPGLPPVQNQWNMASISAALPSPIAPPASTINSQKTSASVSVSASVSPPLARSDRFEMIEPSFGVIGSRSRLPLASSNGHLPPSPLPPSPPASADSPVPIGIEKLMDDNVFGPPLTEKSLDMDFPLNTFSPGGDRMFDVWGFNDWKPANHVDNPALSTSTTDSTAKSHMSNGSTKPPLPVTEFTPPFSQIGAVDFSNTSFGEFSLTQKNAETQTDDLPEKSFLRDMMGSREFRSMLAKSFPDFFDRMLDLKWK